MASDRKTNNKNIANTPNIQLESDSEEKKYFCTPTFCNSHVMVSNVGSSTNLMSSTSTPTCQLELIASEFQSCSQKENDTLSLLLETLRLKGGKGAKRESSLDVPACPKCEAAKAFKARRLSETKDKKERKIIQRMSSRCQLHEEPRTSQQRDSSDLETDASRMLATRTEDVNQAIVSELREKREKDQRETKIEKVAIGVIKENKSELAARELEPSKQSSVRTVVEADKRGERVKSTLKTKTEELEPIKQSSVRTVVEEDRQEEKVKSALKNKTESRSERERDSSIDQRKSRSIKNVLKFGRHASKEETTMEETTTEEVIRVEEKPGPSFVRPEKSKEESKGPIFSRLGINSTDIYKVTMFLVFYNVFTNLKT